MVLHQTALPSLQALSPMLAGWMGDMYSLHSAFDSMPVITEKRVFKLGTGAVTFASFLSLFCSLYDQQTKELLSWDPCKKAVHTDNTS